MKEYRKVLDFEYKKKKYTMFLDGSNKKFFMRRKEDGGLDYVTDSEFAELTIFFTSVPKIKKIVKDSKIGIFPKVFSKGVAVALTLSVLNGGIASLGFSISDLFPSQSTSEVILNEEDLQNYVSLDSADENKGIDTYSYKDGGKTLEIYDMDYLDLAFEHQNITRDMLEDVVSSNNNIPEDFKPILYEYIYALTNKYPDIELRVFYNNLKDLRVYECSSNELYKKTGTSDTYGCYVRDSNVIYVLSGIDYEHDSWGRQVIYHELTHCLRIGNYQINGVNVRVFPEGPTANNEITSEALDSLFAVSLFNYEEDAIAYQLQSNLHKIMVECMDYDLSDYINHSLSYFTNNLDNYNNNDYSSVLLQLIETQFQDYHSTSLNVEASEYYPIYDYICNMYYSKYINDDMTYDEMKAVADGLVKRVTLYVPNDYNIDTGRFYENLNTYINGLNTISKSL